MKRRRGAKPLVLAALAASLPSSDPPKEFRIWPFGKIATTKGTFLFDREAAKSVLAAFSQYGNRLSVDYEHKAVDPSRRAGDGKAAGSFLIELRKDGLWAVDVRWTPPAATALSNKEWLYFSPYFSAEEDSGRIVELINLALTNIPATTHMTPLVAASRSISLMEDDDNKDDTTADDAPPSDDEKTAARKAARARLEKLRAALADAEKECAAFDGEDDETTADGSTEEDETLDDGEDDDADLPGRTATSATVATSKIVAAAQAATGKRRPAEIVGALTALGRTRKSNVTLSKRIDHLERTLRRGEVEQMIARAIRAGKLAPSERDWALSYGLESPGKLRGYLDVTPKRTNVADDPADGAVSAGGNTRTPTLPVAVALSDTERRMCANAGIDPEKFAARKGRPIRYLSGEG